MFWAFIVLCIAISGALWWLFSVDAFLLIILHPVLWAMVALAISGVSGLEKDRHVR
jgi:hypothetical protein